MKSCKACNQPLFQTRCWDFLLHDTLRPHNVRLTDPTPRTRLLISPLPLHEHTELHGIQSLWCVFNSACCLMCWGGWAVCSVGCNSIGGEGAAAIAAGLCHVPSLTRLKYVCVDDRVWESVRLAGYSWGWVCACVSTTTRSSHTLHHTHDATHVRITDPTQRTRPLISPSTPLLEHRHIVCTACGVFNSVCNLVCWGGWAVCSIVGNSIGDAGAAVIAAGLRHVSSLTSLKYVCVEDRVWV